MARHVLQLLRWTVTILALIHVSATQAEQQAIESFAGDFANLHYSSEQWYGSTFWSGPDWTRVGKDWQHPGEETPSVRSFQVPRDGQVTVTGCVYKAHADGDGVRLAILHDKRIVWQSAPVPKDILAMRRTVSTIDPGELGGEPFSFVRVVQPILDKHCVKCHGERIEKGCDLRGAPHQGFSRSYWSLCGDRDFSGAGTNPKNATEALVPRFGMRNQVQATPPGGMYGARGSRLMRLLAVGHEDVRLNTAELRRLAAWIDLNAIFYGVNRAEDQARQLRGESVPMPEIQ